jgi:MFS transporter, ACS family, pantothenate transporter
MATLDLQKESPPSTNTIWAVVQERPETTWRSYVWDTLDKSKAERHFMFKLDAVLTTLSALAAFITALDQVNIHNAFVSGMREDLGLFGRELNYMVTAWTVGYIVGQVPRYYVPRLFSVSSARPTS